MAPASPDDPARGHALAPRLALLAAAGAGALSGWCHHLAWKTGQFRGGFTWLALLAALPAVVIAAQWARIAVSRRPLFLGVATFCVLAALAPRRATYRPEGDEPFYLAQADLLLRNHNLIAPPEEIHQHSVWYFGTLIDPDQTRLINGVWRIAHWPALAAYYLPAAAAKSRWLAQMLVALVVALGTAAGARLFTRLWGDERLGCASAVALVACSPLGQFGLALFPDGFATGVWMIALESLLVASTVATGAASGALAGALVWVKPAYGVVVLAIAGVAWLAPGATREQRWARTVGFGGALAAIVAAFWLFQHHVYGSIGFISMPIDLPDAPEQFALSLFEPGRGLAVHYPLFGALLVAVLVALVRKPEMRNGQIAVLVVAPALLAMVIPSTLLNCGALGGWSPPGRYWIPSLPPLLAALALLPETSRGWLLRGLSPTWAQVSVGVLAVFGALTNLVLCLWPRLAFSDGPHWIHKLSS